MRISALKKSTNDTTFNLLVIPITKGYVEVSINLLAYCTSGARAHKCSRVYIKFKFDASARVINVEDYKRDKGFQMNLSIQPSTDDIYGTEIVIAANGPSDCFITWIADAEVDYVGP